MSKKVGRINLGRRTNFRTGLKASNNIAKSQKVFIVREVVLLKAENSL
jgi:hypothetical protein